MAENKTPTLEDIKALTKEESDTYFRVRTLFCMEEARSQLEYYLEDIEDLKNETIPEDAYYVLAERFLSRQDAYVLADRFLYHRDYDVMAGDIWYDACREYVEDWLDYLYENRKE